MEQINQKNKIYYLNAAITILLMILFPLFPNIGSISDVGMQILGITCGLLYGWIFVEIAWPSILGLLLFGSIGISSLTAVFGAAFGNASVVLCFCFFAFSQLMEELHVTDYIAGKILSLKFILGKPWIVVSMILVTAYSIAFLTDIFPAIFLTWSLALSTTDISGYDRKSPIVGFLLCGIIFSSTMGGMVLPFKSTPIIFFNIFSGAAKMTIDPAKFLLFMLVISILALTSVIAIGRYVLKIDVSKIRLTDETLAAYKKPGTFEQKFGLILMVIFITVLLLPSFLPDSLALVSFLKNWGTVGVLCFLIIIPPIMRNQNGEAVVSIRKMMTGVGWDFVWLLCAIMTISSALNLPDAGIMPTLSGAVLPILQNVSPVFLIVLAGLIVCILTQFVVNIVVGAMFIPIFAQFCLEVGVDPLVCFLIMYVALNIAFATPAASMPAALMHGHENVSTKQAYGYGVLYMVIGLIILMVVGIPLGSILF